MLFRFNNNLGLNEKIQNFPFFIPELKNNHKSDMLNFEEDKALNTKLKNILKKENAIYDISKAKKPKMKHTISDKFTDDNNQINQLSEITNFRRKLLRFDEHHLEESLIDFSFEFQEPNQIKYLESISKGHLQFLHKAFDDNYIIYFFSEEEKKKRLSMINNVFAIHPDTENKKSNKYLDEDTDKKLTRPLLTNMAKRYSNFEKIEFENVLNIGYAAFFIKNFLDHYFNMIEINNFPDIKNLFFGNDITSNKENRKKLKDCIDEDLCLLIIRHINREQFPKEEFPIKYVLLFFILILPELNFTRSFAHNISQWIAYSIDKK